MPDTTKAPAILTKNEREQLLADTEAAIQDLRAQIDKLREQLRPLADLSDELRRMNDVDIISGHAPADVFTDHDLLRVVAEGEWNGGHGSQPLTSFLTTAFAELAPGVCGFEREVASDSATVTRLLPKLFLSRLQDVTDLANALQRIHPALAVDGVMKVDILDHTCGENGSWHLELPSLTTATLYRSRYEDRSGDLLQILEHVARNHWGTDTPA